ncbi:hypothetical protein [Streptomyces griseorubiginosus]|uniref:hypothetical protein n=1 Tax=Streptomyces griseorubiginosus TaxID=67304 RepID=UPI00076D9A51|nr:hypothetical protein [Streptomyces griseorubiginosus]KUM77566.1 hypothetical protein AQI84_11010 [Streptomyces griseorubiginosus]
MTGEHGTADGNGHGMGDERPYGETSPAPEPSYGNAAFPAKGAQGEAVFLPRGAHGDAAFEPKVSYDHGRLEAVLGAALVGAKEDGEAERRAVDAFRVARDTGAHRARTRRRDDWRPRPQRRWGRSWKATLSVLLASLTLGGVAYAAIGAGGDGPAKGAARDEGVRPSVTTSAPAPSPTAPRSSASAPADRPATAKDTLAHCRAYKKLRGRGKALDSTAYRRLAAAAGGAANVRTYCAALTDSTGADAGTKGAADDAKPGNGNGNGQGQGASGSNNANGSNGPTGSKGSNADGNQSRKH